MTKCIQTCFLSKSAASIRKVYQTIAHQLNPQKLKEIKHQSLPYTLQPVPRPDNTQIDKAEVSQTPPDTGTQVYTCKLGEQGLSDLTDSRILPYRGPWELLVLWRGSVRLSREKW